MPRTNRLKPPHRIADSLMERFNALKIHLGALCSNIMNRVLRTLVLVNSYLFLQHSGLIGTAEVKTCNSFLDVRLLKICNSDTGYFPGTFFFV